MGLYRGAERCIRFILLLFLHKANVCSKEWKVFQKFLHLSMKKHIFELHFLIWANLDFYVLAIIWLKDPSS